MKSFYIVKCGKMKIWILSSNRWNSAITEYALSMSLALNKLGMTVIFSPLSNSPADFRARKLGIETISFPTFNLTLSNILAIRRHYRSICPTHIITCGGKDQALSLFINNHPEKLRFRGERIRSFSPARNIIHSLSHVSIKSFITPCQVITQELARISKKPTLEIPIGLDETLWLGKGQLPERPECLIFGRFDPVKGHREFLKVWKLVLQSYAHQHLSDPLPLLKIVGKKENLSKESLDHCVHELGMARDVVIIDSHVEDPSALLSSVSLGIIPSLGSEVICRVAQEFLLCGTPILVSSAGALKEVLFADAGSFFDYALLDVKELVDFVHRSMKPDPEARLKRRLRAIEKFSLNTMGLALKKELG
jgi:glycosyltransferase involved in cell wall biosynthesis